MSSRDFKRLGAAVSDRRAELGLSQEEFVSTVQMSVKTLQRIEAGREVRVQTLGELNRAAQWTAGSAQRVLGGGDPTPKESENSEPDPPPAPSPYQELYEMVDALQAQAEELKKRLDGLSQEGEHRKAV